MELQSISRDVYITHVACDGKKTIQCHSVWDFDRFLAARLKDCAQLNEHQEPGQPRLACVLPATREEYLASKKS